MPKVKLQLSFQLLHLSAVSFLVLILELPFSFVVNLRQVSSERDSTSTRIAELEAQVLSLREEVVKAKEETAAALTRAESAESKEDAASKQEEELTP